MECNNKKFTTVILDKGIDTPLDYFTSLPIQVGSRVLVPVKNSYRKGTVIQIKKKSLKILKKKSSSLLQAISLKKTC